MEVLLVDDDAGSLRGMKLALNMLNHICDAFVDPAEAVKTYARKSYDLVITDINMPIISGLALARMIRGINSGAKIIYVSGQSTPKAEELDTDAKRFFLQKPINFDELKLKIMQITEDD